MLGWCWHRWAKWSAYQVSGTNYGNALLRLDPPVRFTEERQKRQCEKCGKTQDEKIYS